VYNWLTDAYSTLHWSTTGRRSSPSRVQFASVCDSFNNLSRRAVEAGDADAMAHLGHMYANGNGVAQNNVTALRWFKEAAEQAWPRHQASSALPLDLHSGKHPE